MTTHQNGLARSRASVRPVATLAVIASALLAAACGSDTSTGPGALDAVGRYALRSVNDTLLPYPLIISTGFRQDLAADTINVRQDGTFTDIAVFLTTNTTGTSTSSDTVVGTWKATTSQMVLTDNTGATLSGTLGSGAFTVSNVGVRAVYVKQ